MYGILDLTKIDVGATDFGPIGIVFNRVRMNGAVYANGHGKNCPSRVVGSAQWS